MKKKKEIEYFIIGGKGLIGSSIANYLKKNKKNFRVITKQNYNNYKNKNCSIIINANGNSSRYYANTYPKKDFYKSVITVFKSIFDFKYKKYVYISSGDVYEKINKKSNEKKIIKTPCNYYGKNKFLAEQIIKFYCNSWIILRSGPVIGSKLKKIYFLILKKIKKYIQILIHHIATLPILVFLRLFLKSVKKQIIKSLILVATKLSVIFI